MHNLLTLIIILTPLFIGFLLPMTPTVNQLTGKLLSWLVYLILLLIGLEIAQIDDLFNQIGDMIGYIAVLAVLTVGSGLIALIIFDTLIPLQTRIQSTEKIANISIKGSVLQISCMFLGILIGQFLPVNLHPPEFTMTGVLMLLILLVGIDLKASGISIKEVLINKRGIQISLIYTISVLCSGLVYALIFPEVDSFKALALVSGFGWYSLSAIIITENYGAIWGSVAMMNDLIREFFALMFIPLIMRKYPSAALSVGGATSIDVTLPVIQQSGGNDIVPTTISFAFIVNVVSPVLMVGFSSLS